MGTVREVMQKKAKDNFLTGYASLAYARLNLCLIEISLPVPKKN